MILYFSGTGNSRYTAQAIQTVTGDELISINEHIKAGKKENLKSDAPYVFVLPTYAWRMPKVAYDFIRDTNFLGNKKVYFILTCGSETGNAVQYTKKICLEKGFELLGFAGVVMPDNYIVMYTPSNKTKAKEIVKKATPQILDIGKLIKNEQPLPEEKITLLGKFMSSAVNPIFYRTFVSAKGFYSTDTCVSCGKCEQLCPLNNIEVKDGKPVWGQNCTHCMACICKCPKEAIEYKKKSKGKPRYYITGYNVNK
jgi:flavodoxin/NAD-dependent dihydropyrimidine dehydrogenase PreA subunit